METTGRNDGIPMSRFKALLPWELTSSNGGYWWRPSIESGGTALVIWVYSYQDKWYWATVNNFLSPAFSTDEEAKQAADVIIQQDGWKLLDGMVAFL